MSSTVDWECPYCGRFATVSSANVHTGNDDFDCQNKYRTPLVVRQQAVICPNPKCNEIVLTVSLYRGKDRPGTHVRMATGAPLKTWQLLPASGAKPLPACVPDAIVDDYNEACAIRDLSPKASATLARRALQGMIRDFHKIVKPRLVDEINELKGVVDPAVWNAIDALRQIGNIGAHMERDINVIVDVDPDEAQLLIGLLETLVKEWYVARETREANLAALTILAATKQAAKSAGAPAVSTTPPPASSSTP